MVVIAFAWWRGSRPPGRQLRIGGVLFLLMLLAAMFSGVRLAFVLIPLVVLAMILLGMRSVNRLPWAIVAIGAVCFAIAAGAGAATCGVGQHLAEATGSEKETVVTHSVGQAVHQTWLGLGAGSDSTGARYAFPNNQLETVTGAVQEAWYVKTYLELGVFGLAIVLALLITILVRAFRIHQRLRDPRLKMVSAGIIAFMGFVPVCLAHLVSHPIHYQAPLYRELASRPEVDLTVYFYSDASVRGYHDLEYGREVRWDTPLLEGYRSRFLPSAARTGIQAPYGAAPNLDVLREVLSDGYDTIWIHGYAHVNAWLAAAGAPFRRVRVLIREEQTLLHG